MKNLPHMGALSAFTAKANIAAVVATSLALSVSANAANFTWDGGAAPALEWSNANNWTANSGIPGSSDTVTFDDTGVSATTDPNSEVTTNTTIQTLTFKNLTTNVSGTRHTVEIGEDVTLSLSATSGGVILGVGLYTSGSSTSGTRAVITGDGTLSVTGTSRAISVVNASAEALLDMSGLANFTANVSEFRIASNGGSFGNHHNLRGRVKLAETSTITATTITLGAGSGQSQNHIAWLDLGQTTTLNVSTIYVGSTKTQGYMSFQNPEAEGNILTVRGTGGGSTRASNWYIAYYGGSGSPATVGDVDLTGGEVDARVTNLFVGQSSGNNSGTIDGMLTYEDGLVDATNVYVGHVLSGSDNTPTTSTNGTITLEGTAEFRADNLYLGYSQVSTNLRAANGKLIVNGGAVTVDSSVRLGTTVTESTSTIPSTGEIQINGGSVTINATNGLQAGALTSNTASTSILTLAGGSLNMTGNAIGSGTSHIKTLNFRSGTLSNVAEINGGDTGVDKTTGGVLTIAGTNTYSGPTVVSEGTLILSGTITSDVAVSAAATFGGAGSTSGDVQVSTGATVAPGAVGAVGTLSANSLTWDGGSNFDFQLSGASTSDRINLASEFTMGLAGAYTFDFLGTGINGGTYTLLTFDSTTFTDGSQFSYTNLAGGVSGEFILNENSLVFTTAAIPEPGTVALVAAGLGLLGLLRRRSAMR